MKKLTGRVVVYVGGFLAATALLEGAHAPELSALPLTPSFAGLAAPTQTTALQPHHPTAHPWQAIFAAANR